MFDNVTNDLKVVAGLVGSTSLAETYFPGSQFKPKKPCLWSKNYQDHEQTIFDHLKHACAQKAQTSCLWSKNDQYHEYTIFDHLEHTGGDVNIARGHLAIIMININTMINIMTNMILVNTMINITITINLRWRCVHSKRPSCP